MSTLALNMIVGPGEAALLARCLKTFNAKEMFDEIVIVNTSYDEAVNLVAGQYTSKVIYFPWETERYPYGNFGGARNCARDNTTSDLIMWLDTDDVCMDQHKEQWVRSVALVKDPKYANVEMWSMPYALIVDENGEPTMWFRRERIFNRNRIKWTRPIHELLTPEWDMVKNGKINNMFITHLPLKPTYSSALRNVKILEHEHFTMGDNDIQARYFLGRDYIYIGQADKGIAILEKIVEDFDASYDMFYAIAMELVWFYTYGCHQQRPVIEQFNIKNIDTVESWCRLALSYSIDNAEPYVILGDVYWHRGDVDAALRMYLTASRKTLGAGKLQTVPFYQDVVAERLSRIFQIKEMSDLALHHNKVALRTHKNAEYIEHRRHLLKTLTEEFNNEYGSN